MKTTLYILLTLLLTLGIKAQESSLEKRELLVEKEYSDEIYASNPLFDYSSILTPDEMRASITDSLSRMNLFTPDLDISVRPVAYKNIAEDKTKKGFLKFDKGQLIPLHLQGGYTYSSPNYFNVHTTFSYDHRSESNFENKYIKTIQGKVGLDYYLTNELLTKFKITVDHNTFGLFGHGDLDWENVANHSTGYTIVEAKLNLQSFKTAPSKWNYGIQGSVSRWQAQEEDVTERNLEFIGKLEFRINDRWGIYFLPSFQTSLETSKSNNHILGSSLRLTHNSKSVYLRMGSRIDRFDGTINFWPDVDLRWNMSKQTVFNFRSNAIPEILSHQRITQINPYSLMGTSYDIRYFRTLDADISSQLSNDLDFTVRVGYLRAANDLNFFSNPSDIRFFRKELITYNRLRFSIMGQKRLLKDYLVAGLALQYDKYDKSQRELLHRPTLFIRPSLASKLFNDRLTLAVEGLLNNPQEIDRIPALISRSGWNRNLNAEISIEVNDHLKIHLNADNIFDTKYAVWNGYDNFGRNLSGGLLLKM